MTLSEDGCPGCGSQDLEVSFGFQQYGSSVKMVLEVDCPDCDHSGTYSRNMIKE